MRRPRHSSSNAHWNSSAGLVIPVEPEAKNWLWAAGFVVAGASGGDGQPAAAEPLNFFDLAAQSDGAGRHDSLEQHPRLA